MDKEIVDMFVEKIKKSIKRCSCHCSCDSDCWEGHHYNCLYMKFMREEPMTSDDCKCPRCCNLPGDPHEMSWFFMFVAALLLAATMAAIKVHDRSRVYIKAHTAAHL